MKLHQSALTKFRVGSCKLVDRSRFGEYLKIPHLKPRPGSSVNR